MNSKRSTPWLWIVLATFAVLFVGGLGLGCVGLVLAGGASAGPDRVALIEVSGAISDQGARGLVGGGGGGARSFIEDVAEAKRDPSIKAVVIRVNSPGGAAAASQEMYQAVQRLRRAKPVVCSMGDVAASGGYYVASACDKIFANGSTLTGSIGVISQFLNYQDLFKKVGLDEATIKSGKFKDAGNPSRRLTPEERKLFQAMIMNVYTQFINDVLAGRKGPTRGKLSRGRLMKLADGRVYTGQQAKANLLIDELGGLHEAVEEAARLGGIAGQPVLRRMGGGSLLGSLFGAQAPSSAVQGLAETAGSAFADGLTKRLKTETVSTSPELR